MVVPPAGAATAPLSGAAASSVPAAGRRFGDYELLEEIARGGVGVVFKARQVSLNRLVAVKMLLSGRFASAEWVKRFQAEAEAAAHLQHPNIVAIHEVGQHEGQPFFSMAYVAGRDLGEVVAEGPLPARRAASHLKTIAEAIHYAHQRGVLHRDLKPSNVLMDEFGEPRVTDFGLAKRLQSDSDLTLTGQVLGTPNYMPPEQASARQGQLGPASDVYSLGAILYHLLTGRPPFMAETLEGALAQVLHTEPVPPRVLNPDVPRDLETICLKCLTKEPHRRYASAQALADDLGRWLNGEPILARPASVVGKAWRWCRRKPAAASLLAVSVLLLLVLTLGPTVAVVHIAAERAAAEAESRRAVAAEQVAREKLRESYLAQARALRFSGRPGRRFDSLAALSKAAALDPPAHLVQHLRDEAIACLALADIRLARQWDLRSKGQVGFLDRQLRRCIVADADGALTICPVDGEEPAVQLQGPGSFPEGSEVFSRDGRLLVARYHDGVVRVVDLETGQSRLEARAMAGDLSPDDRQAATTENAKFVCVYDLASGELQAKFEPRNRPRRVKYSPDGAHLAVAGEGHHQVVILDARSGAIEAVLSHADSAIGVAWHPDGAHLATTCADQRVYLWNVRTGQELRRLEGHFGQPRGAAFSHAGDLLVTAGLDNRLRLWSFPQGEPLVSLANEGGHNLQFSSDDRFLGCNAWNGQVVTLYEVAAGREGWVLFSSREERPGIGALGWGAQGTLLAFNVGQEVRFWNTRSGHVLGALPTRWLESVVWNATGQELFLTGDDGLVRLRLTLAEGAGEAGLGPPEPLYTRTALDRAALSADGRRLAAVHDQSHVHVFDTETGEHICETPNAGYVRGLSISPDGELLVTSAQQARGARVWNARSGKLEHDLHTPGVSPDVAFSPDGRWLAVDDTVALQIREVEQWTVRWSLEHTADPLPPVVAFSPDGRLLADVAGQSAVRLMDLERGEVVTRLDAPSARGVSALGFSPDGTRLALARGTAELQVWDLASLRASLAPMGLDRHLPVSNAPPSAPLVLTRLRVDPGPDPQVGLATSIPPRSPEARPNLIDLSGHYNAALTESWHDRDRAGNDLAALASGVRTLAGTQFDVRGLIQLGGMRVKRRAGAWPARVSGMRVDRDCRRLHFLHGVVWKMPDGTPIGHYLVHYANGRQERVPILYGEHVREWHTQSDRQRAVRSATEAWVGRNAIFNPIRVFKATWENPLPDQPIESLDFVSEMTEAGPFLIAVTAE